MRRSAPYRTEPATPAQLARLEKLLAESAPVLPERLVREISARLAHGRLSRNVAESFIAYLERKAALAGVEDDRLIEAALEVRGAAESLLREVGG